MLEDVERIARRVFGGAHPLTEGFEHYLREARAALAARETPLSLPAIDNMRKCTEAGAVVLPASPGWYHGVTTLRDLVDFVAARICDQLRIDNCLMERWGTKK